MKLVQIYEGSLFEAQMLVNLLENEQIESSLKDEIRGSNVLGRFGAAGGVKVIISDLDYERARTIVEAFEKSMKQESSTDWDGLE